VRKVVQFHSCLTYMLHEFASCGLSFGQHSYVVAVWKNRRRLTKEWWVANPGTSASRRKRASLVGILTTLPAGKPRNCDSVHVKPKRFSLHPNVCTGSGFNPGSYSVGTGEKFTEIKALGTVKLTSDLQNLGMNGNVSFIILCLRAFIHLRIIFTLYSSS